MTTSQDSPSAPGPSAGPVDPEPQKSGRFRGFSDIREMVKGDYYRRYLIAHILHVIGWWANRMALTRLAWDLTGSSAAVGLVAFTSLIPIMVVAPLAGAVADQFGHRRTGITTGFIGCVIWTGLSIMALSGTITIPVLVVLTIVQAVLFAFEFPARQALIGQLVSRDKLASAVAVNSTSHQIGGFIGPIVGGLLIIHYGPGGALMLYVFTTLFMASMLLSMTKLKHIKKKPSTVGSILSDLKTGFAYAVSSRPLALLLGISLVGGLFCRPYTDLMPEFSDVVFGRGEEGQATLLTASGIGATISALWLVSRGRNQGLVRIMLISSILAATALIGFTMTRSFDLALIVVGIGSMMLLVQQVSSYSMIQTITKPEMRGRVISIYISVSLGAPALGALVTGWIGHRYGLPSAVMGANLIALVLVACAIPAVLKQRAAMERVGDV